MVVRQGFEADDLAARIMSPESSLRAPRSYGGRSTLHFIELNGCEKCLIRPYHHGGLLRFVTTHWFFTWPPRPLREVWVTEEVRKRGVPSVEIVAALVLRGWGPFYRGWLVTRQLQGAEDLWIVLREHSPEGRDDLLRRVGACLKQMHLRGVYHADLNLRNILVCRSATTWNVHVIDFDKAKLLDVSVPASSVRRNLERLRRSIHKLDPSGRFFSDQDWRRLQEGYGSPAGNS